MIKEYIVLLFISPLILCALPPLKVENRTGKIINAEGEEIILHGVNVVVKLKPWIPRRDEWDHKHSLSKEDIRDLKDWGFNAVRLGIMWPGYDLGENENEKNDTYINEIERIVNELGESGIYTLLDMHQDLLTEYFCGEGIPDYLIEDLFKHVPEAKTFPAPLSSSLGGKKPERDYCLKWKPFAWFYLSRAANYAFEELYNIDSKISKKLHKFWSKVAEVFKNNTNVLGYEFINEPITGNLYKNPFEFFDPFCRVAHKTLEALYHSLAKEVRKIDDNHIIVFEPSINGLFTSGFEKAPGGKENISKQIYSYHIYCPFVDASGCPLSSRACDIFDSIMFFVKSLEKKYFGCAALLTEFGALSTTGTCIEEIHRLLSKAESYNDGWMYWQYKQYNDPTTANTEQTQGFYDVNNGSLHKEKVKALTRPYARKIAGRLKHVSFDYNDKKHTFKVEYDVSPDHNCNSTLTEIYVNRDYYVDGEPKIDKSNAEIKSVQDINHIRGGSYRLYTIDHSEVKGKKATVKIKIESK